MTPERFAEIELYTKHLTASGQLVGGCLRECLEEIARLRADASTASPSCDRCQSAHCCSVTGSTVPPLCVTDPDGSLPLWMPWTNADVQARVDPLHAEIGRLRAEAGRVVVPELTPDGMSTAAFVEGYRFAASRAHSVPSSRVLKDGEVAVDREEWMAINEFADKIVPIRDNLSGISWVGKLSDVFEAYDQWYAIRIAAGVALRANQGGAAESAKAREVEG